MIFICGLSLIVGVVPFASQLVVLDNPLSFHHHQLCAHMGLSDGWLFLSNFVGSLPHSTKLMMTLN